MKGEELQREKVKTPGACGELARSGVLWPIAEAEEVKGNRERRETKGSV